MAVCDMKLVTIIGGISALDGVSRICGNCGFFQVADIQDFCAKPESLEPFNFVSPYKDLLKKIEDISGIFGQNLGLVDVDRFVVSDEEIVSFVDSFLLKTENILEKKKSIIQNIESTEKSLNLIAHFCGLNLDLTEISKCEYVSVRFGRLSKDGYEKFRCMKDKNCIEFFPCKEEGDYYWGVYFAPRENLEEVDSFFDSLYFENVDVDLNKCLSTPELTLSDFNTKLKKEKDSLKDVEAQMASLWNSQKDQCMRFYTKLKELESYFSLKKHSYVHANSFLLMGYVPAQMETQLNNLLDSIDSVECKFENIREKREYTDITPVKLKNNCFAKPFEIFVKMYGLPKYKGFDPTMFVAVTYTILYGIMFGDLGHGIVLFLAGLFLKSFKNFSLSPIMVRCGASASVFGVLYGSLFGYETALNPFYKAVFGLSEKPIEVMSQDSIPKILATAIVIGVIFVVLAMIMNIISSFISGDIENGLFGANGICGMVFYVSVLLGSVFQFILSKNVFSLFYILLFIVAPLLFMFFKTPITDLILGNKPFASQSFGEYVLQNIFEMFTVILEYITNTVSFLRVGAYVLVHAGLMMAIFIMASMFPAFSIFIVVLGNAFVIGFEGLLVGIQVLRLEFYEVFSRCFSGGGKEFQPVKVEKLVS